MRNILILVLLVPSLASARDIFAEPTPADVEELVSSLNDANLRRGAANALVSLGKDAVPKLTESLAADDVQVRIWAAYCLGKIGPPAETSAPALAKLLADSDGQVRSMAVRSLGQIRTSQRDAIDALAKALSDPDVRVRKWSAVSLGQIGAAAAASLPQLIVELNDQPVRADAIDALVGVGKPAISVLIESLKDDTIRLDAAAALRRIDQVAAIRSGVEKVSPADLAALRISLTNKDRDESARIQSARQLGELGEAAVPILIGSFEDDSATISREASAAFARIGAVGVPELQKALQHSSARTRAAAADAIGAVGSAAKLAVGDLASALKDPAPNVRHRAVIALAQLGPASAPAVPALIELMNNPRDTEPTRQLALKTLLVTGDETREQVIAALKAASKDDNYGIRSLADEQLSRLEAATTKQ